MTDKKEEKSLPLETRLKVYEFWLKVIGTVFTLMAILIGLFQYFDRQAHENYMEFKRNVWRSQYELYSRACALAGDIAANPTSNDFEVVVAEFNSLYWGEMALVDDPLVTAAMKEFYFSIKDFSNEDPESQNNLKILSNELVKACKESSQKTWMELKPENEK